MNRYVVAVSGGVDSVVLLDMLARGVLPNSKNQISKTNLIVAHFDHGIRPDSADDAIFVAKVAKAYGITFETKREELGPRASEDHARTRRYTFLRDIAQKHQAKIMTAHHLDDLVETVAINLTRGTGWRGLAVLDSPDIERPLLDKTKAELIEYAKENLLEWHEDSTNRNTKYLRNDLRQRLVVLDIDTKRLLGLYRNRQAVLKRAIERESVGLVGESPYSRHPFIVVNESAGLELLRAVLYKEIGQSITRPQLARALHAIKVFHTGKVYIVGGSTLLRFTKTHFIVETSA